MATKPTPTFVFAPQSLYSSGPFIGSAVKVDPAAAAEGYVPGTVIPSEFFNFMYNASGLWSKWLESGSSAAGEDAHVMETDSAGTNRTSSIRMGATTAPTAALVVSENTGFASYSAIITSATGTTSALRLSAGNGHALDITQVDNVATLSPIALGARSTLPSSAVEGDLTYQVDNMHRAAFYNGNAWRFIHASGGGFVRAYNSVVTEVTTTSGGSLIAYVLVSIPASANLIAGMMVHIRATMEVGASLASAVTVNVGVTDTTAATIVTEDEFGANAARRIQTYVASTGADERYVTLEVDYQIPLDGVRSFVLGYASDGSNDMYIRFGSLEITGQY